LPDSRSSYVIINVMLKSPQTSQRYYCADADPHLQGNFEKFNSVATMTKEIAEISDTSNNKHLMFSSQYLTGK